MNWFRSWRSFLWQLPCPLCKRQSQGLWCSSCERQLQICQRENLRVSQVDLPLFVWGHYEGNLKRAIAILKYEKRPELGLDLGRRLGLAWIKEGLLKSVEQPAVLPIPLHPSKRKLRGFNQAERIAQGFCQVTDYQLVSRALLRVKETQAMFELPLNERRQNIRHAFQIGPDFAQLTSRRSLLLVDDIYTTGATVREAIQQLRRKDNVNVKVLAIAIPKK
ncbi:MAG: ComF family protein [Cyanobacteria bacterium P01_H01_bin.15]